MNEHQRQFNAALRAMTTQPPPAPWRHVGFVHVGGLHSVGFGATSDLLLIVSSAGRGVVDCATGEKLARDHDVGEEEYEQVDAYGQLLVEGIGPLAGKHIPVSGIFGGGLPTGNADGWSLELVAPDWPNMFVLLCEPFTYPYAIWSAEHKYRIAPIGESGDFVVAYGFAPTGSSFVVAYSHGVDLFARP